MVNELLGIQYNIAKANVTDRKVQNLASYININSLRAIHKTMDKNKASGIDKVTKEKYEQNLEENLENLVKSAQQLREQHDELRVALEKNVTEQQDLLHKAFEENRTQIETMRDSQEAALKWLNQSAQAMHDQYQQIADTLQKNVKDQEASMITAFQENMARIIEHYLLEALGSQFDVKEQLPGIIKQLEERKQDIVEDMTL